MEHPFLAFLAFLMAFITISTTYLKSMMLVPYDENVCFPSKAFIQATKTHWLWLRWRRRRRNSQPQVKTVTVILVWCHILSFSQSSVGRTPTRTMLCRKRRSIGRARASPSATPRPSVRGQQFVGNRVPLPRAGGYWQFMGGWTLWTGEPSPRGDKIVTLQCWGAGTRAEALLRTSNVPCFWHLSQSIQL